MPKSGPLGTAPAVGCGVMRPRSPRGIGGPARPSGSGSRRGTAMSKRRKAPPQPEIDLHINTDDERVLEAVANLLLDLTRHRVKAASEPHDDEPESR